MRSSSAGSLRSSRRGMLSRAAGFSVGEFLEPRRLFSTFTVTNGADSGSGSLRQEISLAEAAGSGTQYVQIATTSTIALNSTVVIASNANLVITYNSAEAGSLSTITTSGEGATLQINSGATVVLSGLSIQGGADDGGLATIADNGKSLTLDDDTIQMGTANGDQGSALQQSGGSVIVNDCSFTGANENVDGGGIYDTAQKLTIYNSSFSTQCGNGTGGGIYNQGGVVSVYNSNFTSAAVEAGAVQNTDDGTLNMTGCQIDTIAAEQAGGIENDYGSTALIQQSTFDNCFASETAGAVWNMGTFGGISDTFEGNENGGNAETNGGALANQGGTTYLYNSTFYDNTNESGNGGAMDNSNSGVLVCYNCTVTDNETENYPTPAGGGISSESVYFYLYNTIVAANIGSNFDTESVSDITGTVAADSNNLIGTGGSGGMTNTNGNIVGVSASNLHLASLAWNGGPTETVAPMNGSPALGAGSVTAVNNIGLTTDQRGLARIVSGKVDIGAYETQLNNAITPGLLNLQFTTGAVQTGAGLTGSPGDLWTQASPPLTNSNGVNSGVVGEEFGYENLTTTTGAASSVQASFEAGGATNVSSGSPFAGTYLQNLMEGYLISYGQGSVDFTGLAPSTTYELYLYSSANSTASESEFAVGVPGGSSTDHYIAPSASDQTLVPGANYTAITQTSDSEGRINISFFPAFNEVGAQTNLNGIQIEPIDAWTGAADGVKWSTPGNWSEDLVPTQTTNAVIGTGFSGIQLPAGIFQVDSLTASSPVTLESAAVLVLNGNGAFLDGLTIDAAAGLQVATPAALTSQMPLVVSGLAIMQGGILDLARSAMVVPSGSLPAINSEVASGYNNGGWNGTTGIISSVAQGDTTHLSALGVILNNNGNGSPLYGSGTTLGPFDSYSPTAADVLVKYTYYGDANLDGKVNGSDYSRIDNGAISHLTGWYNGDFNYDGAVNGSDYSLIDNASNRQGPQIGIAAEIANPLLASAGADLADNISKAMLLIPADKDRIAVSASIFQTAAPITFSDSTDDGVEAFLLKKDLLDQLTN